MQTNGVLQEGSTVYKRGRDDKSLWDDTDLIRLWNAQLEKENKKEGKREDVASKSGKSSVRLSDDDSVISSALAADSDETAVTSSSSPTALNPNSANNVLFHDSAVSSKTALQTGEMLRGMPADMRRVVLAYYSAGYEAGYFVGRTKRRRKNQ